MRRQLHRIANFNFSLAGMPAPAIRASMIIGFGGIAMRKHATPKRAADLANA